MRTGGHAVKWILVQRHNLRNIDALHLTSTVPHCMYGFGLSWLLLKADAHLQLLRATHCSPRSHPCVRALLQQYCYRVKDGKHGYHSRDDDILYIYRADDWPSRINRVVGKREIFISLLAKCSLTKTINSSNQKKGALVSPATPITPVTPVISLCCITEFSSYTIQRWSAIWARQTTLWIAQSSNPYLSKLSASVTFTPADSITRTPSPSKDTPCSTQPNNIRKYSGTGLSVLMDAPQHVFGPWKQVSSQIILGHKLALRVFQEPCKGGSLQAVTLLCRLVHFIFMDVGCNRYVGFSTQEHTQSSFIYWDRFGHLKFQCVFESLLFLSWMLGTELICSCWSW